MKKILSTLLVAMLIVTSLATVAFATGTASASVSKSQNVKTGDTVTLTVGVTGEYSNYEMTVSADSGLEITNISGVTHNVSNGKVAYSSGVNVTEHYFTVTVKVNATEPGTYNVYATPTYGSMIVDPSEDTEDGVLDGRVRVTLAGGSCALTIVCDHQYGDWETVKDPTCTEDGSKKQVCSVCGDEKFETISKLGHDLKWFYNDDVHWQECQREGCDHKTTEAAHQHDGNGYCVCGHYKELPPSIGPDDDDELPMGDITPMLTFGAATILMIIAAAAYLLKRKFAK